MNEGDIWKTLQEIWENIKKNNEISQKKMKLENQQVQKNCKAIEYTDKIIIQIKINK